MFVRRNLQDELAPANSFVTWLIWLMDRSSGHSTRDPAIDGDGPDRVRTVTTVLARIARRGVLPSGFEIPSEQAPLRRRRKRPHIPNPQDDTPR